MFDVELTYMEGKKGALKTITGTNVPCDGPFGPFWVLDIGEKKFLCINRACVVSIRCVVPEYFIIPPEQITIGQEMQNIQFEQQMRHMSAQPEGAGEIQ